MKDLESAFSDSPPVVNINGTPRQMRVLSEGFLDVLKRAKERLGDDSLVTHAHLYVVLGSIPARDAANLTCNPEMLEVAVDETLMQISDEDLMSCADYINRVLERKAAADVVVPEKQTAG